jgi:hypothetical protein
VYEPEWNDDALNEARVGRVESNVLEIHVREPAPACVRGARTRALIQISRDGDEAVASLTNLYDLPVVVNLNIAGPVADAPMASLKWAVERHDRWAEKRPVKVPDAEANPTFHHDRLKSTPPGATIELQRMPIEALRAAAGGSDIAKVSVYYVNQASIGWQRKKAPGEIGAAGIVKPFDRAFPRGMLETAISATEMIPLGE